MIQVYKSLNEADIFGGELLELLSDVVAVPVRWVVQSFSVMHDCDDDCTVQDSHFTHVHERVELTKTRRALVHSNRNVFAVNPFRITEPSYPTLNNF